MTETLRRAIREVSIYDREADADEVSATIAAMGCPQSIDLIEKMLKHYKGKLNELLSQTIPDELHAAGVSSLKTDSGEVVSVDRYYQAQFVIPENATDEEMDEIKGAFYVWLAQNGYGDIVKTREVYGVHPSTLKKWAGEIIKNSLPPPPEHLVKINVFERASIKRK